MSMELDSTFNSRVGRVYVGSRRRNIYTVSAFTDIDNAKIKEREKLQRKFIIDALKEYYEDYNEIYNHLSSLVNKVDNERDRNFFKKRVSKLKDDLRKLNKMLDRGNVEESRRKISQISSYINNLIVEVEDAIGLLSEICEVESKLSETNIQNNYQELLEKVDDPIVKNFVLPEFFELVKDANEKDMSREKVEKEWDKIIKTGQAKAQEWLRRESQQRLKREVEERINSVIKELKEKDFLNKEEVINKLIALMEHDWESLVEAEKEIEKILISEVKKVPTEDVRKFIVKSIFLSLKKQGFILEKPLKNKETDEVIIKARRPSGNWVECKVNLDGKFIYRFDGYEGMACEKDIEKFKEELEKIYGIKIEDEVVTWRNPDRLSKDGHRLPTSKNNRK